METISPSKTIASRCSAAVTLIQRFGSALNLNPHLHMLFLDGAYAFDDETPRFHRVAAPTQAELQRLLHTIATRTTRALERQGLLTRDDETSALDIKPADDFEQLLGATRPPLHRPALGFLPPCRLRVRSP